MNETLIDNLILLIVLDTSWLVANFAWITVHELAHLFTAQILVGARLIKLRPWPHRLDGDLVGGSVSYRYPNDRLPSKIKRAMISLAPQVVNVTAALLLPLAFLFNGRGFLIWSIVWSAGIIDLMCSCTDRSKNSDLTKTVKALSCSPWVFHIGGFVIALISIGTWIILAI